MTRRMIYDESSSLNFAGRMLAKRRAPTSVGLSCALLFCVVVCYVVWYCVARNLVAFRCVVVLVPRCWRPYCDALRHGVLCRDVLCNASFLCSSRLGHMAPCWEMSRRVALAIARYCTLRYSTLRYTPLRYAVLNFFALRHASLRYATLRYPTIATLRDAALCCASLRYATLRYARCPMLRYATLRCATRRCASLLYATLRYATLRHGTQH